MWRQLQWECGDVAIRFSDSANAAIFMDFGSFQTGITSGTFDRRAAPSVDGTMTYSASLGGMRVPIDARVLAFNMGSKGRPVELVIDQYKRLLCDAFNPKRTGILTYKCRTGEYFLTARPESIPGFGAIDGGSLPFTVDLYSDDPYWQSTAIHTLDIGVTNPLVSTPMNLPAELGQIISTSSDVHNVTNNDIYPVIRFWPSESRIELTNETTGKRLRLNTQISDGLYVDVDTAPTKNTIILYRLNSIGEYEETDNVTYWLTLDSDSEFYIVPGINKIRADYVTAGTLPAVTITWREREVGV